MVEKIVHLNALDLDVFVPANIFYFDDGFVETIEGQKNFLTWKYSGKFALPSKINNLHLGRLSYYGQNRSHFFHCFYIDANDCLGNLHTRAHEETHFLHAVKRLGYLERLMEENQGVKISFDELRKGVSDSHKRKEIIADIGGIFAVHRDYGFKQVEEYCSRHKDNFCSLKDAWQIYQSEYKNSRESSGVSWFGFFTNLFKK